MFLSSLHRCVALAPESCLQICTLCAFERSPSLGIPLQGRARRCIQKRTFTQSKQRSVRRVSFLPKTAEDNRNIEKSGPYAYRPQASEQGASPHQLESKASVNTSARPPSWVLRIPEPISKTTPIGYLPSQKLQPNWSSDEEKHSKGQVDALAALSAGHSSGSCAVDPIVATGTGQQSQSTKLGGEKASLSIAARDRLVSSLPSRLQDLIKKNLLADEAAFNTVIYQDKPERWVCEALASLIQFELDKPRGTIATIQHHNRRRRLKANAMVIQEYLRDNLSNLDGIGDAENLTEKQIELAQRMRDHYVAKLQQLSELSSPSVTSDVRKRQLEVLVRDANRRLELLQLRSAVNAPESDEIGQRATVTRQGQPQITLRDLEALIVPKSATLPARLQHQLSRDLLDSLNEACFDFGQSQDPAFMQQHEWTSPESIDSPVFLFSMMNHLELFERFTAYHSFFGRLRTFRNRHVHGMEITPLDEIILLMHDVKKIADLLESASLSTKVSHYRVLLIQFRKEQAKFSEIAYSIARTKIIKLRDIAQAKVQTLRTASRTEEGDVHVDTVAEEGTINQIAVRHAADVRKVWEDTESSLALHHGQQLSQYAVEAQIRRLVNAVGPVAQNVLLNLHNERPQNKESPAKEVGATNILQSLESSLSHRLTSFQTGKAIPAGPHIKNQKDSKPSPSNTEVLKRPLNTPPEKQSPAPAEMKDRRRRLLGEIAKGVRQTQASTHKESVTLSKDGGSATRSST